MALVIETFEPAVEDLRNMDDFESALNTPASMSLSALIREGSRVTEQAVGTWGEGTQACALSAAYIAAKAHEIL